MPAWPGKGPFRVADGRLLPHCVLMWQERGSSLRSLHLHGRSSHSRRFRPHDLITSRRSHLVTLPRWGRRIATYASWRPADVRSATEPKPAERSELKGADDAHLGSGDGGTFGGCVGQGHQVRERESLCGLSKVPSPRKPLSRHIEKREVMAPPGTVTVAVERAWAQSAWQTGLSVCPPAGAEGGTGN